MFRQKRTKKMFSHKEGCTLAIHTSSTVSTRTVTIRNKYLQRSPIGRARERQRHREKKRLTGRRYTDRQTDRKQKNKIIKRGRWE